MPGPTPIFVARKLVEVLLRPSTLILACALAGALLLLWPGARLAHRLGTALLAGALASAAAIALFPVDAWLLAPLEDRFPPMREPPADAAGVVVLGGALETAISGARGRPSLNGAAERMVEFARLARTARPDEILAFTGGSGSVLAGGPTEAAVARALFASLGLDTRRIVFEDRSRTTWQNAALLADLIRPRPSQLFVLVTSAMHMPRAVAAFRAHGWTVAADPVAYKSGATFAARMGPDFAQRLVRLDSAAHEWEGLIADRVRGRTARLLPGPDPVGG